jgi:putative two-component system response regulator
MTHQLGQYYFKHTGSHPKDLLTGLYNHGFFHSRMNELVIHHQEKEIPLSLVVFDIDHFALMNRRDGHIEGDKLLKEVGEKIAETIRDEDLAARLKEDLFALLLPNIDLATAPSIARRIHSIINNGEIGDATVSIGIAALDYTNDDPNSLLGHAFSALDLAKIRGKNRIDIYIPKENGNTDQTARVLIVDDDKSNAKLLDATLNPLGYETAIAYDGETAMDLVRKVDFDLILLDVMMPGVDGYEVCKRLKGSEETRHIPVIMITALHDIEERVKGIEAGADDFLSKPTNREELLARTQSLIKVRTLNKNYTSIENVLISLANAVEAKDSYTQGHTERVSQLAEAVGARMGLPIEELEALRLGGILHDVGKIGVPEEILNKPGPLDEDEWVQMRAHTELGYSICLPLIKTLGKALDIVRHHHEKLDGSSYPDHLSDNEISVGARIMSVVDIYDALITDRPYRKAVSINKALEILMHEAEEGKLDQRVVSILKELVFVKPEKARRQSDSKDIAIKTVLVVEDDILNIKLIKTLLEVENCRIKSVTSAEMITDQAKRFSPDLIIMDIQLPGIDGLEATRILKRDPELSSIPVVAVSAHAMQNDIEEAKEAGCEGYITKPVNTKTFAKTIIEFIK